MSVFPFNQWTLLIIFSSSTPFFPCENPWIYDKWQYQTISYWTKQKPGKRLMVAYWFVFKRWNKDDLIDWLSNNLSSFSQIAFFNQILRHFLRHLSLNPVNTWIALHICAFQPQSPPLFSQTKYLGIWRYPFPGFTVNLWKKMEFSKLKI